MELNDLLAVLPELSRAINEALQETAEACDAE
jgi:hypothetical protein